MNKTNRSAPTETMAQRQGVENLLASLNDRFINLTGAPLEDIMRWAVAFTGQSLPVDCICLILYQPETHQIHKTYAWNHPDLSPQISLYGPSLEPFQWILQQLNSGNQIQLDDVDLLPAEASAELDFFHRFHIRSVLDFPFNINNNTVGIISFLRAHRKKAWKETEVRQFKLVADTLANCAARIIMEDELHRTIQRYQSLYNHSPIAIWEEDFSQTKTSLHSLGCSTSDELRGYLSVHPEMVFDLLAKIKVVDVNETTIKLWNHSEKNNLVGNLKTTLHEQNLTCWIEELVAIFEGRLYYLIEDQLVASKSGSTLHANLYWSVVPGHEKDWSQVLVSAVDITKQIQIEESLHESEERLRMMLENAEDIILLQDLNGKYLYYNGMPRYGMSTENMVGKYPSDLHEPLIAEEIMQTLVTVTLNKKPVVIEIPTQWGGQTNWFSNLVYPILSPNGGVIAVGTISRNITKRKITEQTLAETQKNLSIRIAELEKRNQEISLLSEMLTMLQVASELEDAYKVIHMYLQQLFGGLGGSLLELQSNKSELVERLFWGQPDHRACTFRADDCWAIRTGKKHFAEYPNSGITCPHVTEPYPHHSMCIPFIIDSAPGGCLHIQSTADKANILESDIRLAQAATEQIGLALSNIRLRIGLRQQAIHDALTGLYNRHYLEETMTRELYRVERSGQPLSLIMMDLDHLKQINDIYGHAAGDAVLRELGRMIKRSVRVSDMPCRYGGDEFILVMPDTTLETAVRRAEYIAENFRRLSIPFGTQTLGGFSVSIGVSCSLQHGHTSQDLMDAADHALYQAKGAGRDRVVRAEEAPAAEKSPL
jgi:diguanylate cyclase (GGDEF)-like protein/PAS domain S-box-containing protein